MAWIPAAASIAGSLIGAFGNKEQGPSLADNMRSMYGIQGMARSSQLANAAADYGAPQFYPGATVGGFSPYTGAGIQSLFAAGGTPFLASGQNLANATMGGAYLNSNPANAALGQIGGGAGGYYANPAAGGLERFLASGAGRNMNQEIPGLQAFAGGGMNAANPALPGLGAFAGGAELGGNPYLDAMFGAATGNITRNFQNAIAPALASQFSLAGRTGSGAHAGAFGEASNALATQLGNVGTNLYGQAYEAGRQRQLSALNSLGSLGEGALGRQYGALGQLGQLGQGDANRILQGLSTQGGLFNAGIQNQLAGLTDLSRNYNLERGLQSSAMNYAPQMLDAALRGANAQIQAGNILDTKQQDLINAERERWDFNQNAPWDIASRFASIMGQAPGVNQWAGQSNTYPRTNTLMSGLGGALAFGRLGSALAPGLQSLFSGGSPVTSSSGPINDYFNAGGGYGTDFLNYGGNFGNMSMFGSY